MHIVVRVVAKDGYWQIYRPCGQPLDRRKTEKGALKLARRLFPSAKIVRA